MYAIMIIVLPGGVVFYRNFHASMYKSMPSSAAGHVAMNRTKMVAHGHGLHPVLYLYCAVA